MRKNGRNEHKHWMKWAKKRSKQRVKKPSEKKHGGDVSIFVPSGSSICAQRLFFIYPRRRAPESLSVVKIGLNAAKQMPKVFGRIAELLDNPEWTIVAKTHVAGVGDVVRRFTKQEHQARLARIERDALMASMPSITHSRSARRL